MTVRDATVADIGPLARLWHDSWHRAHDELIPPAVVAYRTASSFEERLRSGLGGVRVAARPDIPNGPSGLCIVKGDELNQLFVAPGAFGTGVADQLERDAQRRFREAKVDVAWLACAIGNERAAGFYERCKWVRVGSMEYDLQAGHRTFPVEVWRYEKSVLEQV